MVHFNSKCILLDVSGIIAGIIAADFTEPYAYYILGIVTGLSCIIPAIIVQKNYRKQERENG